MADGSPVRKDLEVDGLVGDGPFQAGIFLLERLRPLDLGDLIISALPPVGVVGLP